MLTTYFAYMPAWARITFAIGDLVQIYPTILFIQWMKDQSNISLLKKGHLLSWIFTASWIIVIFLYLANGDAYAESLMC